MELHFSSWLFSFGRYIAPHQRRALQEQADREKSAPSTPSMSPLNQSGSKWSPHREALNQSGGFSSAHGNLNNSNGTRSPLNTRYSFLSLLLSSLAVARLAARTGRLTRPTRIAPQTPHAASTRSTRARVRRRASALLVNYCVPCLVSHQLGGKWSGSERANNPSQYGPDGLCPANARLEQELFEVRFN